MLKVIEKVDRILKLEEYKILMQKLSKTDDEKEFNKTLDNMNNKEKSNFEEAVIGLRSYKEIITKEMFPEEEKFLFKIS